jgi:hypothetical protein
VDPKSRTPVSLLFTRHIFRSIYVTGRQRAINHKRGADTTVAHYAENIYHPSHSLCLQRATRSRTKKGYRPKRHITVIYLHHTTTAKKRGHFVSKNHRVLRAASSWPAKCPASPSLKLRPLGIASPHTQKTHQCYIRTSIFHLTGPYDYAASAGVTVPQQTCLFNSVRE